MAKNINQNDKKDVIITENTLTEQENSTVEPPKPEIKTKITATKYTKEEILAASNVLFDTRPEIVQAALSDIPNGEKLTVDAAKSKVRAWKNKKVAKK